MDPYPYDTQEEYDDAFASFQALSKREQEEATFEWKAKQQRLLRMEQED